MNKIIVTEETRPRRIRVVFECGVHWNTFFLYVSTYGMKFRKFKDGGGFAVGPIMVLWGQEIVYIYELEGEAEDEI